MGTVMQTISTVFSLLVLSGCAVFGFLAMRSSVECKEIEDHLRRALGRISGNEAEIATLTAQIHKLRGKLYSLKPGETEIEIAKPFSQGLVCENWKTAQTEGPLCEAASCECDYCIAKRVEREDFRARAVPKTTAERRNAIEKGKH